MMAFVEPGWSAYATGPTLRPQWGLGALFIAANPEDWHFYFVAARLMLLPLMLLGGYMCYRWSRELYGEAAGLTALGLWVFSPNLIAWGSTITPDASATAMGVLANYYFWRWLRQPDWPRSLLAGLTLGLVELTKMTWIVLFPLWPVLWLLWAGSRRGELTRRDWGRQAAQVGVIVLVGLYVLNLGYAFEGSFQQLEDYTFVSRTLAGEDAVSEGGVGGNRFAGTWLGQLPVPVPKNYLAGMDLQKLDFEEGMWSYLNGQWKHGGWWYYYLYALLLKVPLGSWLLLLMAAGLTVRATRSYSAGWRNELILLAPAVVVFVLVSSQTGFSRYLRYALPCFPFVFIWISKVARSVELKHWRIAGVGVVALLWSVGSSLWVYPHSLSYFNELAGGPKHGHYYLIDANIDWGQDLWYLKEWYDAHPEARPLHASLHTSVELKHFGIESAGRPPGGPGDDFDRDEHSEDELRKLGPQPGWYAMSVHQLHERGGHYDYFLQHFEPVEMIGYSISIYHITPAEANRARREMGLPEIGIPGN